MKALASQTEITKLGLMDIFPDDEYNRMTNRLSVKRRAGVSYLFFTLFICIFLLSVYLFQHFSVFVKLVDKVFW